MPDGRFGEPVFILFLFHKYALTEEHNLKVAPKIRKIAKVVDTQWHANIKAPQ
jgi:hypothetical protein